MIRFYFDEFYAWCSAGMDVKWGASWRNFESHNRVLVWPHASPITTRLLHQCRITWLIIEKKEGWTEKYSVSTAVVQLHINQSIKSCAVPFSAHLSAQRNRENRRNGVEKLPWISKTSIRPLCLGELRMPWLAQTTTTPSRSVVNFCAKSPVGESPPF